MLLLANIIYVENDLEHTNADVRVRRELPAFRKIQPISLSRRRSRFNSPMQG